MADIKELIQQATELIKETAEDRGVPKNIRSALEEAKTKISVKELQAVNISTAIYILEDISNDTNMPSYARTTVWEIISLLEEAKEKIK